MNSARASVLQLTTKPLKSRCLLKLGCGDSQLRGASGNHGLSTTPSDVGPAVVFKIPPNNLGDPESKSFEGLS